MIKKISTEVINAIKDGAVVELGANSEIKMIGEDIVLTIDGEKIWDKGLFEYVGYDEVKTFNILIDQHNTSKLYEIIETLFTEMDYSLTFEFCGFTLGLLDIDGEEDYVFEKGIYVIPTNAKEEDDWNEAIFYKIGDYFETYADILRGERDIIEVMVDSILEYMDTAGKWVLIARCSDGDFAISKNDEIAFDFDMAVEIAKDQSRYGAEIVLIRYADYKEIYE